MLQGAGTAGRNRNQLPLVELHSPRQHAHRAGCVVGHDLDRVALFVPDRVAEHETQIPCVDEVHLRADSFDADDAGIPQHHRVFATQRADVDRVALYVVAEGWLEVTKVQENLDGDSTNDRLVLARIAPPSTIGEMQILTGGKRSATVTASLPTGLVKFPKPAFDWLLAQDHRIVEELTKTIMPRLFRDQMVSVLPKLFGELDKAMLRDLEQKMTWLCLPRGQVLCRQGDLSDRDRKSVV